MLDIKQVKLRTESAIIASWKNKDKVIVSVVCTSFNHEVYIEDAIIGFLMQETDFRFEVIIHDDASIDKTASIILHYQQLYPNIIKSIIQNENQYSKGNFDPISYTYSFSNGQYIALCEGDDYWIDKSKLSKQTRILDEFDDVDLCFHSAVVANNLTESRKVGGEYSNNDSIINLADIISKKNGQIMTASTFVRKNVILQFGQFVDTRPWLTVGDIYIHFFGSMRGGAYYLNNIMSVYRVFNPGSWTSNSLNNYEKRIEDLNSRIKSYEELDEITENRYREAFYKENKKRLKMGILDLKNPKKVRINLLSGHKRYYSTLQFSLLYCLIKFDFLVVIIRYIKRVVNRLLRALF